MFAASGARFCLVAAGKGLPRVTHFELGCRFVVVVGREAREQRRCFLGANRLAEVEHPVVDPSDDDFGVAQAGNARGVLLGVCPSRPASDRVPGRRSASPDGSPRRAGRRAR